jgi:hypothetical protein
MTTPDKFTAWQYARFGAVLMILALATIWGN